MVHVGGDEHHQADEQGEPDLNAEPFQHAELDHLAALREGVQ